MKTDRFKDLTDEEQLMVCAAHQEGFKNGGIVKPLKTFRRLFELGNPKIVLDHAKGQVRIHEESAHVMKIILKNYL